VPRIAYAMSATLQRHTTRQLTRAKTTLKCTSLNSTFASRCNSTSVSNEHYNVVVAGGGAVGSVLARLLLDDNLGGSNNRRPIKIALLEQRPSPPSLDKITSKTDSFPNPRAYALSPTSLSYLGPSVLQSLVKSNRCGIYDSMQIWEHDGPAQLHFVGDDLEEAINDGRLVNLNTYLDRNKDRTKPWLGAVVEDASLVSAIWDELRTDERIDLLDNIQIKSIESPSYDQMGKIEPPPHVNITCCRHDETVALSADLLVAADGANSFVRKCVGNFPMVTRSYGRKAVTCTVEIDTSKGNWGMAQTAFQRFLPHGPIALLPVWNSGDQTDDRIYANVVWSTTPSEADHLLSLSPSEFVSTLNHYLCQGPNVNPSLLPNSVSSNTSILTKVAKEIDSLLRTANTALTIGTWTEAPSRNFFRMPPRSVGVVSPILGFDLTLSHVSSSSVNGNRRGGYTSPRVALVGDAAHTMHPMAGQGLNLGMGDVNVLSNLVKEAIDSGMDVGGTDLFLDRFNDDRMLRGWGTVGGVHSLHEIFGQSGSVPISVTNPQSQGQIESVGGIQGLIGYSRSMGMNIVNGIGPVRRALAEVAAGAVPRGLP
jgi:ubiquinone biosynthesis monooxygenase Coq6